MAKNLRGWLAVALTLGACGATDEPGGASSSSSSSSSSSASSSASSSSSTSSTSSSGASVYQAVTNQYVFDGITTANALFSDSDHFRIYFGGNGRMGARGNLGANSAEEVEQALDHLEAAYQMFVEDWGWRSPGLSINPRVTGAYKLNVYSTTTLEAGGVMLFSASAGLSYLEVRQPYLADPGVIVHELGHSLTLTEYQWVDQGRTGAWWEALANWVADTYQNSDYHAAVAARHGQPLYRTLFDPEVVVARSFLTVLHADNRYQVWPFFTYLSQNPDGFPGLGAGAVVELIRQHPRNNETPLHTLQRMVAPRSVQEVLAHYNARLAYGDFGHPRARQRLQSAMADSGFRARAYRNLTAEGGGVYRVLQSRRPMYGGSNIIPLRVTAAGIVDIEVIHLGTGRPESALTAIAAIGRGDSVRYVSLTDGVGQIAVAAGEEASLVVSNTPTTLYQYDAFASQPGDPDVLGLDYRVRLSGAVPRD